ncbi:hypothetical protein SO802_001039 [Lithocarpus litseifolius]|uniref:Uncharacterized protein n=1 Tax=Lithocarpus litseifolius TaxID=425828 RepID=A0AAW2DX83_9ROSI
MLQELNLNIYSHPNPPLELHPSIISSFPQHWWFPNWKVRFFSILLLIPSSQVSRFCILNLELVMQTPTLSPHSLLPARFSKSWLSRCLIIKFENTSMLKIVVLIPTLKILYLSWLLEGWSFPFLHFYILRLNAPALEHFYFHGLLSNDVVLENLPNLVKSGCDGDYAKRIWDFMRPLYNIVSMEFCIETAQILCDSSNYNLPVFNNLTSLTFDGELSGDYYVLCGLQYNSCFVKLQSYKHLPLK